jgi:hypothetical protein
MKSIGRSAAGIAAVVAGLLAGSGIMATSANASATFLGTLTQNTPVASTVPASNGDVNPYGVAVVPRSTGDLVQGDVLVSNFNNSANQQGTGTTIVQVSPTRGDGGNGDIVETTPGGQQVAAENIDLSTAGGAAGDLFGLAVSLDGSAVYYVNDGNNMLYRLS